MDQNNLILVEQYFRLDRNDFNKDTKFSVIERIKNARNIELIVEK